MAIVATVVLGPRVFTTGAAPDAPREVVVAAGAYRPDVVDAPDSPSPSLLAAPVATSDAPAPPPVAPSTTAPAPPEPPAAQAATPSPEASASTSTTEALAPTTTTSAPAPTTTTAAPAPTTTTAPPAPPTTAPPPPPPPPEPVPAALAAEHADGVHEGYVSWYDLPGSRAGVCAHRTIERGTVVTVTNLDTGAWITCTVDDRGPYSGDDKVLDLHRDDFARLAPLDQGVFPARLDW